MAVNCDEVSQEVGSIAMSFVPSWNQAPVEEGSLAKLIARRDAWRRENLSRHAITVGDSSAKLGAGAPKLAVVGENQWNSDDKHLMEMEKGTSSIF